MSTLGAMDMHLLKREIELLGESLEAQRLAQQGELGHVKLELDTLKRYLEEHFLGFENRFEALYREEQQKFNPENSRREKSQSL
ncbi:hypothetical protein WDW86_08630 [Bdellovibrionota bacterium FG-2]